MRYKIWIALIMCGTLLVLAPPISDYMASYQIANVLEAQKESQKINFIVTPMSGGYRFGCFLLGATMIGVGVFGGWREPADDPSDF